MLRELEETPLADCTLPSTVPVVLVECRYAAASVGAADPANR
jgi:hypothetical protein